MLKRVLTLVVTFGLIASLLLACAQKQSSHPAGSMGGQQPSAVQDGPLVPYEKMITVTVPGSIGANVFYAEGEDFEENFVTNMYREKLKID